MNPFALIRVIRGQPIFCFAILPVDAPKSFDRYHFAKLYLRMRFLRFPITLAFVIMAVFISAGQDPSGAETGFEGVITISPAQPGPTRADAPGSQPLANAAFVVENEKGEVASFKGKKTRDRPFRPLRSRCCAGQNGKGPVGMRFGYSIEVIS